MLVGHAPQGNALVRDGIGSVRSTAGSKQGACTPRPEIPVRMEDSSLPQAIRYKRLQLQSL